MWKKSGLNNQDGQRSYRINNIPVQFILVVLKILYKSI